MPQIEERVHWAERSKTPGLEKWLLLAERRGLLEQAEQKSGWRGSHGTPPSAAPGP